MPRLVPSLESSLLVTALELPLVPPPVSALEPSRLVMAPEPPLESPLGLPLVSAL